MELNTTNLSKFFGDGPEALASCIWAFSKYQYPSGDHPATRFTQDFFSLLAFFELKTNFTTALRGKASYWPHTEKRGFEARNELEIGLKRIQALATFFLNLIDVCRLVQSWAGRKVVGAKVDVLYTATDLMRLAISIYVTRHTSKRPYLVAEFFSVAGENSITDPALKLAFNLVKIAGIFDHYKPKK